MAVAQDLIDRFVGAAHGDFETVRALLAEEPALLNHSASWVETAIEAAAQTGQVAIAEHLLAAGAPLGICTAAMLGRQADVERLLPVAAGGPNATGAHGLGVLYHAIVGGHAGIADLLLERGADIHAGATATAGRTTPLHGAVIAGRPDLARWLLDRGADPHLPNRDGQTPLDLATAMKRESVAEVLRRAELEGTQGTEGTPGNSSSPSSPSSSDSQQPSEP